MLKINNYYFLNWIIIFLKSNKLLGIKMIFYSSIKTFISDYVLPCLKNSKNNNAESQVQSRKEDRC